MNNRLTRLALLASLVADGTAVKHTIHKVAPKDARLMQLANFEIDFDPTAVQNETLSQQQDGAQQATGASS